MLTRNIVDIIIAAQREVRLLRLLNSDRDPATRERLCIDIVKLVHAYTPTDSPAYFDVCVLIVSVNENKRPLSQDVYLVMEYVPQNLHNVIRSIALNEEQIEYVWAV